MSYGHEGAVQKAAMKIRPSTKRGWGVLRTSRTPLLSPLSKGENKVFHSFCCVCLKS